MTAVGATHFTVDGIAVACVDDPCSCPIPGHNPGTIKQGDAAFTIDGKAVACAGHMTSCGAVLQSTLTNFSAD